MTAKLLALGHRPYEVPTSYRARDREQGKKITWKDGCRCSVERRADPVVP